MREVQGSSPCASTRFGYNEARISFGVLTPRGYSSVGRALEWHSRGRRFDPDYLHHKSIGRKFFFRPIKLEAFFAQGMGIFENIILASVVKWI